MITGFRKTLEASLGRQEKLLDKLLGPLPEELEPLVQDLKSRFTRLIENDVNGHFEIGQVLKREIPQAKSVLEAKGLSAYGARLFEKLGERLDVHPRVLRDCLRAAECFSPEQYQSLIVANGLTWSHGRLLAVAVPDRGRRERLIARTVAEELSVRELATVITGTEPKKPRCTARTPAKPRSLPQGFDRLRSGEKRFQDLLQTMFSEEFDLLQELHSAPLDVCTPEMRAVVSECADQLEAIESVVRDVQERLQAEMKHIDARLASQAELDREIAAKEEEEKKQRGRRLARAS